MKKSVIFLIVFVCMSVALSSCAPITRDVVQRYQKDKYVYLVTGFDDASKNTDVIFTLSYDTSSGVARIAQIPRDTYCNFGKAQNKINQIYASKIASGENAKDALAGTSEVIADIFGTKFDGYIGVTIETFKKMVDAIGGLDIEIGQDMALCLESDEEPLILKKGNNHIDGECAERFVRFRSGYAMGDLGRIDAQKIFLNALFTKLISGMSVPQILGLVGSFQNDVVTNIKLMDSINVFIEVLNSETQKSVFYATVPGEPILSSNGLSFYVLNRKSTAEMMKRYMLSEGEFDKNRKCLNSAESGFVNIYEDDSIELREYSNKNISDMHIISD